MRYCSNSYSPSCFIKKKITTKTDIKVIRIIKRRVLGKVIPTKSIPPLIQEGAVTSTFLAPARLSLLTKDDKTPPVATPNNAESPQVDALITLPFAHEVSHQK